MADKSREQDGGSSIPDEEWARFLREAEADHRTGAPAEPSARARMVTERLRREDAAGIRPAGWRAHPDGPAPARRRGRRRLLWVLAGAAAVAGLAVLALGPAGPESLTLGDDRPSPSAAPVAPQEVDPDAPTPDDPFRGTPAADYADGAAGIVPPRAKAVGDLSAEEVASALRATREMLIDGNLEPAVLVGAARPERLIGRVDPLQTTERERIQGAFRAPSLKDDPLSYASRFDPAEVRLVGDVVRTKGAMSFERNTDGGVDVRADYTFVYPVVRAEGGSGEIERVVVRRLLVTRLYGDGFRTTPGTVYVAEMKSSTFNSVCDAGDGFLHPFAPQDRQPTGAPEDAYDRDASMDEVVDGDCGVTKRT
ncbi:hypothetical protein [Streptomyces sp. NPDC060194]|uniref:hypothetical protein n=1 Tax=Streptomyces sp. NPDC060194 TaxID=3347069 RepID=UPI00366595B7